MLCVTSCGRDGFAVVVHVLECLRLYLWGVWVDLNTSVTVEHGFLSEKQGTAFASFTWVWSSWHHWCYRCGIMNKLRVKGKMGNNLMRERPFSTVGHSMLYD